jgi:uncharacterized protein YhbP (UPF0306 family)
VVVGSQESDDLRALVAAYLRAHHTMTISTAGPTGSEPHAASVFYAVDDALRLVFLSKPTSVHGRHIGEAAPVAVTVTEEYEDWDMIQGVQLWGVARLLGGTAKAGAFALYLRRFPFVRDLMSHPAHAEIIRGIGVYRIEPERAGFTDNSAGVFGRKMLQLMGE